MLLRVLLILASASFLLIPATASAAELAVTRVDGSTTTAALDGQPTRQHTVQGSGGDRTVTGTSIGDVLRAADVQPFDLQALTVSATDGASLALDREAAFGADGPVLYADEEGLHLVGGGRELLAPDGRLLVALSDARSTVDVTATGRPTRVEPGDRVVLTAASPTDDARFSWQLGDGGSATGRRVVHRFAERGRYTAVVGVTTAEDPVGASAIVVVQVGAPQKRTGSTSKRSSAPPASPAPEPEPEPAPSSSGGGDGSGSSDAGSGGSSSVAPSDGSQAEEAAPPAPATRTRRRSAPKPRAAPPEPANERAAPADAPAPPGDRVSGELLDPAAAAPVAMPTASAGDEGGGREGDGGPMVSSGVLTLGGTLVLGLAGFGLDLRRSRPRGWFA